MHRRAFIACALCYLLSLPVRAVSQTLQTAIPVMVEIPVQALTSSDFELTDGSVIPISKRVYSQIKKMYMDYLLTGNEITLL